MNATAPEPLRWSGRRWLYTIAVVFLVQTGLLLFLGRSDPTVPARPNFRTRIHFISDPWSSEQLSRLPDVSDPTLFALPHPRGFSGVAWLHPLPFAYAPARWSEPPRWLTLDPQSLGHSFAGFVAAQVITPQLVADHPAPPLLRFDPDLGPERAPAPSRLELEAPLAARGLLAPLELPSWTHTEVLSNSIVQATIDADGHTLSTRLLGESGHRPADLRALQLAAAARFRPLPRAARAAAGPGPLTWGQLIFHWRTLPIDATNPPPGRL